MMNLKGLNSQVSRERRATFSGLVGRAKRGEGKLLIPQCLLAKSPRRTGDDLLNLKDLLTVFPASRGTPPRVWSDDRNVRGTDLLIPQGLSTQWTRRTRDGLLNLKDLLAGFPPSLRRLFENEPVGKPRFCAEWHQISPFSTKTWAEYGRRVGIPRRPTLIQLGWELGELPIGD